MPPSGRRGNVGQPLPGACLSSSPARPRRYLAWSLLLLLASLGATALAALQAHRAAELQRRTAEQLLHDYGAFAQWSYQERVNDALKEAAWQVLNPILHREVHMLARHPNAASLDVYYRYSIRQCVCTPSFRPATYFAYTLGSDTIGTAGAVPGERLRHWMQDTLSRRLRNHTAPANRVALMATAAPDSSDLFAYGLMPTYRGDTIVYGFSFDRATLPAVFASAFEKNDILPRAVTQGRANDSIIAVRVMTPGGATLFASSAEQDWHRASRDTLRAAAGGLTVAATVRPALANLVLSDGKPQSALLVALMIIAAALTIVAAVQLRREEDLVRLRTDFVSSVSHELRTPLAQVRLFLETLRLGRFTTEEQREWLLGHIDRETTRLTHLVENVLHFSRASRQNTPVPPEPSDVGVEISETVRAFAPLALSRQVDVRPELGDHLVAPLDRAAFRQLLLNLLDNALKYGPAGQTVTVRARREAGSVRVSVTDQGPGIVSSERERVFEPYYRGRSTNVRAVGGSGIGLSVVREVAERHGGRVWIEASTGGATIVVELPAPAVPAAGTAA